MHSHCEIILPPMDFSEVEAAVASVLKPFDEDQDNQRNTFWDWYEIGGRWSGCKRKASIDPDKLEVFINLLTKKKFTVSGVVAGKQTLKPESQIPMVDALWHEHFPDSGFPSCPLFTHAGSRLDGDIMRLMECPRDLAAARIIIAVANNPAYGVPGYHAETMITEEFWNGVMYQEAKEACTIANALAAHEHSLRHANPEVKAARTPSHDWLVVTVDYHS